MMGTPLLSRASKMLKAQSSAAAKQMVEYSIAESRTRLDFLEKELRKLVLKDSPSAASSTSSLNVPVNDLGLEPADLHFGIHV